MMRPAEKKMTRNAHAFPSKALGKRGELHVGFVMLYALMFLVLLLAMASLLLLFTGDYMNAYLTYYEEIPPATYAYRAINNCLAFQDNETLRYYPGLLDFSQYNEENLTSCFADTERGSFNFRLTDANGSAYPKILVGFGASLRQREYDVLIRYDENTVHSGVLAVGVSMK